MRKAQQPPSHCPSSSQWQQQQQQCQTSALPAPGTPLLGLGPGEWLLALRWQGLIHTPGQSHVLGP